MLGFYGAAADIDGRAHDRFHIEQVERNARADNIGNGIGGSDFVKMHLFHRHLVYCGLRFAEPPKYSLRIPLGAVREAGLADHLENLGQVTMRLVFLRLHPVLSGGEAVPLYAFERRRSARPKGCDRIYKRVLVGAGIGQRAHQHIAADA